MTAERPASWPIKFYESPDEGCPVREFLDGLDKPRRSKVLALIKLLEELGPALPFPYSSQLRGKLRELRTHYGKEHYRLLYFGDPHRVFVLLSAFVKRTEETPDREIATAEHRMASHLRRTKD
jgi:hypothetical protein